MTVRLPNLFLLACAFTFAGNALSLPTAKHPYPELSTTDREEFLDSVRNVSPLATRIDAVSAPFLGTPYGVSPLGEGTGFDPDPRIRWDLVDCLTFVETTMAMALTPTNYRLPLVLDDIRYSVTPPAFERRNHIVEAQWVPSNFAKGYLQPISREIAGDQTTVETLELSAKRWHARSDKSDLPLPDSAVPMGKFSLDVVPIEFAREHVQSIPGGTVLFVVRSDEAAIPTLVTHSGIVLDHDGKKVLRHAAKEPYNRVIDEPLASFIARNERYESRKVIGFSLFEVLDPAKRIASLPVTSSERPSPTAPP